MRPLLCCLLAPPVAPAAAEAQAVAGDYGGGAITRGSKPLDLAVGSSWMRARVGADGRARIGGSASVACGLTSFDAEVAVAADGTFRFSRVRRTRQRGHRLRAIVTVRGCFDGATASGTVQGGCATGTRTAACGAARRAAPAAGRCACAHRRVRPGRRAPAPRTTGSPRSRRTCRGRSCCASAGARGGS